MIELSVVIICYNQQEFISKAIESVFQQTACDRICELIVVDDGSRDNSRDRIEASLRVSDILCHKIFQENGGAASARNSGIQRARGTHIAFLDGDDLWQPDKLKRQLKYVEQYSEVGLFFSDYTEFDDESGVEHKISVRNYSGDMDNSLEKLFVEGGPIIPTVAIVRRDVFDAVGYFDTTMKYNEDPEMWLRIASRYPLHKVPGVAARKRIIDGSLGSNIEGNARFFKIITERMIKLHPELSVLRRQREQRMVTFLTSALLHEGRRGAAIGVLFDSLRERSIGRKGLLYLVACLLPIPSHRVIDFARWSGNRLRNRSAEQSIWN